jgi:hypothetical protein
MRLMSALYDSYVSGVIDETTFRTVTFVASAKHYQSEKAIVSPQEALRRSMILWGRAMRGGIVIG